MQDNETTFFCDRKDAGQKLGLELEKYLGQDVVVFALTRGGVPVGNEVAKFLNCPLEILVVRKIGHPNNPEYAIGAVSEIGDLVLNEEESRFVDQDWLRLEVDRQIAEAKRRRKMFSNNLTLRNLQGKNAVIVDDGIATGYTMQVAIMELKHWNPSKIIVAVPVVPFEVSKKLAGQVDEFISLFLPKEFLGSVGAYYKEFSQIEDVEVLEILN